MLSKKEAKDIQSLNHKKHRETSKLFLAEGPKVVAELLSLLPGQLERILALPSWEGAMEVKDPSRITIITQAELERISALHTPNQVVAVFRQPQPAPLPSSGFFLFLDAIQDPGNFGTIIRIADWFGIRHIVCGPGCADLYNPKVVQSTMGSIARVNIVYDEEGTWLGQQHVPVYAAALDGTSLYEKEKTAEGILVIGNESKGISPEVMRLAGERITIPRKGGAESLNAAVATGIILSHLLN